MPGGGEEPQLRKRKGREGATRARPSAGAVEKRQLAKVSQTEQASPARSQRLSSFEAAQPAQSSGTNLRHTTAHGPEAPQRGHSSFATAPESWLAALPAAQARASSTSCLARPPQGHLDLPLRARGSQRPGSSGISGRGGETQNFPLQPGRPSSSRSLAKARVGPDGVAASHTNISEATATVGNAAGSSDPLWNLFENWATTVDAADECAATEHDTALLAACESVHVPGADTAGLSSDQAQQNGPSSPENKKRALERPRCLAGADKDMTEKDIAEVNKLRAARMSWRSISRNLGISPGCLRRRRDAGYFENDAPRRRAARIIPTEQQVSDVQKYFAEGKTCIEVSKLTGIKMNRFRDQKSFGLFGTEFRDRSSRVELDEEQITQVKKLLAENKSWLQIGRETGITRSVLARRRREGLFGDEHRDES